MTVTINLPDDIAPMVQAIAAATRRPVEDIVVHLLDPLRRADFAEECELAMRDDETDAAQFIARMCGAFESMTGAPFRKDDAELMRQRLDGEIDQDTEMLLREASRISERA